MVLCALLWEPELLDRFPHVELVCHMCSVIHCRTCAEVMVCLTVLAEAAVVCMQWCVHLVQYRYPLHS